MPSGSVSFEAIVLWNSAPRPAIPVAMPTCRNVLLVPDAMPDRSGGTTLTAVEASAGLVSPMPMPPSTKPGRSSVQPESGPMRAISSSETPMIARPAPISQRAETREVRLPETAATTNAASDSGRNRSPAWSGE